MPAPARGAKTPKRTASPEARRQQLIDATLKSIAARGIAGTTLGDVARTAGLSQGIVNLHFESKDKLFNETLRFLADEYRAAWEAVLAAAGPIAARRLQAMVALDFSGTIYRRDKIAVWFAFWGEAKARPTYRRLCSRRDKGYREAVLALCREINDEGDYGVDPVLIADGISAFTDGFWLDRLLHPGQAAARRPQAIVFGYLAQYFPQHFDGDGAIVEN